jgi:hypothetical protein
VSERGFAKCPVCKRDVRTASDRIASHNSDGTFEMCKGSRTYFARCDEPGMVSGEACIFAKGHDGAHACLPRAARAKRGG